MQAVQPSANPVNASQVAAAAAASPTARLRAFKDQREELSNQLSKLEERRHDLVDQMTGENVSTSVKTGLEVRVAEIDKRIADVEKQVATADGNVASASAIPGAVVPPPVYHRDGPPEEMYVVSVVFILVACLPLSIAMSRRVWRKSAKAVVAFPQELSDRLSRLDQAVDSIAVEVERIGEGQRFITRVMADGGRSLGAGPAQPVAVNQGAAVPAARDAGRGRA